MKYYIICLFIIFQLNLYSQQKYYMDDIRIFKNTPVWKLAKALNRSDTISARKILKNQTIKNSIDFQEKYFQATLLYWAVYVGNYNATKFLAENGANPNIKICDSTNAMIYSAGFEETTDFLTILIKHGGDVNTVADINKGVLYRTPLCAAATASNIESVRILIKNGANPNFIFRFKDSEDIVSPLSEAALKRNIKIVKYLLMDVGVEFNYPFMEDSRQIPQYITDRLRFMTFDIKSEEYLIKMEVVNFLKERGMDYRKTEIPINYYNLYSKDYLDKY